MRPTLLRSVLLLVALLAFTASGCGTIGSRVFHDELPEAEQVEPGPYSGVRLVAVGGSRLWHLDEGSPGIRILRKVYVCLFVAIDMPLSAVADTLLLPYDLATRRSPGST